MLIFGYVLNSIVAYFLGSIPTGFLVAKAKGIDIRTVGSGNMGATNVFRTLGRGPGTFVLAIDVLKGFVASRFLGYAMKQIFAPSQDSFVGENFAVVAGLLAILGHNYTCWLQFKGGKGIATSLGVLFALYGYAALVVLGVFILVLAASRYVSLASVIASIWLPIIVAVWRINGQHYSGRLILVALFMGALAVYKHTPNIQRLLKGTERRIGDKSPPPEAAP